MHFRLEVEKDKRDEQQFRTYCIPKTAGMSASKEIMADKEFDAFNNDGKTCQRKEIDQRKHTKCTDHNIMGLIHIDINNRANEMPGSFQ